MITLVLWVALGCFVLHDTDPKCVAQRLDVVPTAPASRHASERGDRWQRPTGDGRSRRRGGVRTTMTIKKPTPKPKQKCPLCGEDHDLIECPTYQYPYSL